jgi:3-deoxy-D-manno-octulosonic-acid transferase
LIRFIYNSGIKLYTFILKIAAIINPKAKLWIDGRKDVFQDLKKQVDCNYKYSWFHCASLGEFEQARPLIEVLKNKHQKKILVTFFSPSGYEIRKDYKGADIICYLPTDTTKNAKLFLETIEIESAFFIKYEFWYNYIHQLHLKNIPLYLVSGVFRENQLFFKPYGKWFKKHLSYFKYFFVQNRSSLELLKSHNIHNSILTGDTRFDRVIETLNNNTELNNIDTFKNNNTLIVLGSSWKEEEEFFHHYLTSKKANRY